MKTDRKVTATTSISAPVERVWEVLTDFKRYSSWHPVLSIDRPANLIEGALLEGTLSARDGASSHFMVTIVDVESPRRLVWTGGTPGILIGTHSFLLDQRADRTTGFTDSEEFSGSEADTYIAEHPRLLDSYIVNADAIKRYVEALVT
jgi:hypothetical protein